MNHAPTAAVRGSMDKPRHHGGHTGPVEKPLPKAAIQITGEGPRPHGGHEKPRGRETRPWRPYGQRRRATPPRHPYGAQGTSHTLIAAVQGIVDGPCRNGRHTGPRGVATPHGSQTKPRRQATPPRWPYGVPGTFHAPTVAIRGPGDGPRLRGGHMGPH